jgi:hypothetical protein
MESVFNTTAYVDKKKLGRAVAISQVGGIIGIVYAFQVKSGFLKGAGYYLLGGLVGGLAGMAYYNFTVSTNGNETDD